MKPKVFISYSWTSPEHQGRVKELADRLILDGVEVILDVYDLKEGHDKFAFMEKIVSDQTVTHVLIVSDREYAKKADSRRSGVGAESQIISKEVYEKTEQSKFVPLVAEFDELGEPCLPTFLASRIWMDFSQPESTNRNWEALVRLLYGKPLHEKPALGKTPAYILEDSSGPPDPLISKWAVLKQSMLQGHRGLATNRQDFLDSCVSYADSFRVRERPSLDNLGQQVLEDYRKLKLARNYIVNWVALEQSTSSDADLVLILLPFLERILELKSRPPGMNSWNDSWFDAHSIFAYEIFLYVVAVLIRNASWEALQALFSEHYLLSETSRRDGRNFGGFDEFWVDPATLKGEVTTEDGRQFIHPVAELFKRNSDRPDVKFTSIAEADLLAFLVGLVKPGSWWYPQTLGHVS